MGRLLTVAVLCALLLSGCGGKDSMTGRFLKADDGSCLLIDGDGAPVVLSDRSGGDLFANLSSGDRIRVTHDGLDDSWPARTGAYTCTRLEQGRAEDLPGETMAELAEAGWVHLHAPAETNETVADPVSGYCGNTVTKVRWDGGEVSFWGGDSVELTDLLINLTYDGGACSCLPEITVDTEFGDGYGVSLTGSYVRRGEAQTALTAEQVEKIQAILQRQDCAAAS